MRWFISIIIVLLAGCGSDGASPGWKACQGPACVAQDHDNDGIDSETDNCPFTANRQQLDQDRDGLGDACDRRPATAEFTMTQQRTAHVIATDPNGLHMEAGSSATHRSSTNGTFLMEARILP